MIPTEQIQSRLAEILRFKTCDNYDWVVSQLRKGRIYVVVAGDNGAPAKRCFFADSEQKRKAKV